MNLHEFFHINTFNYPEQLLNAKGELFESHPRGKVFYQDGQAFKGSIEEQLYYSDRAYNKNPFKKTILQNLLQKAYVVMDSKESLHGSVPSAGGLFPLEIYVAALNIEGIDRGIYHFDKIEQVLTPISYIEKWTTDIYFPEINKFTEDSPVILFMTCNFENIVKKYGARGYRYALIEAGHIGQNVRSYCARLNLASCPIGAFYDDTVNSLLNLQPGDFTVYAYSIGEKR
ncbi:SagB/ThcOx family dehydrogenase [Sporosarcina sp. Marseille-Q4943]|uniref:SagB/ThcOx family dehydrogenase n=1 Tax=Sporosarcina sp. Marseille-Q4943 TaxID=2942204 RepID=UPI00208DA305|nr:SagB/ThcOx family dehydrogenase [Sporosarcina sp. Marseille-Q4943]